MGTGQCEWYFFAVGCPLPWRHSNQHKTSVNHYFQFIVLAGLLLCCALTSEVSIAEPTDTGSTIRIIGSDNKRFYVGDNPDWSRPDVRSDNWEEFDREVRAHPHRGLFWMAFDVHIEGEGSARFDYEYHLHMYAAQEVYWDDLFIGSNGKPAADKADEIPGQVWTSYLIPGDALTPGVHELRIRGSNHYRLDNMKFLREGWIVPYDPSFRYVDIWSLIPSLLVSIGAVVGVYFLMLFFTEGRQYEHLVFFFLLEGLTVLGYAIQWDHLVGYSYDWEPLNLALEYGSILVVVILLPFYFLLKHGAPRPWLWILVAALITAVVDRILPEYDTIGWLGSFMLALVVSVYYGIKSGRFLWWESLGLCLCIYGLGTQDFEDVFIYFPTLFSFILLTHAVSMQQRRRALRQASYVETQLRSELLRRHIQPHFLLNTLTSLMEWVETDVDRSTEFIAELAEEFRLMSRASSQALIDLDTELDLCRRHLSIMSLRLQKHCTLETEGIDGSERIPPAIFHTLIENAFSHNVFRQQSLTFLLQREALDKSRIRFKFRAPLGGEQTAAFGKLGTGTGRKYIEARLAQAFSDHWSMQEQETETEWITEIVVRYDKLQTPLGEGENP